MELTHVVFTIGGIPLFASRVFITALAAALPARFAPDVFPALPAWVTADRTLFVLLVLALVENRITKSSAVAGLLARLDPAVKTFAAFLFIGVALAAGGLAATDSVLVMVAVVGVSLLLAAVAAAGVWWVARLRNRVLEVLVELDEDDELGVRRLLSWAEDGWAGLGMVFLVFFPMAALALSGLCVAGLLIVERVLKAREERSKAPCAHCGRPNYRTAVQCLQCRRALAQPRRMGVFGQATAELVTDLDEHRLRLMTRRRCIACATRLPKKSVRQICPGCGTQSFHSPAWAERYMEHLRAKLPRTLAVLLAFGLVPFLGLIPGIIYYRLSLISGINTYIPGGVGCMARWGVRFVTFLLLAFQWVPAIGAATLPLMCCVNYWIYGKVLERELATHLHVRPQPAMAPT